MLDGRGHRHTQPLADVIEDGCNGDRFAQRGRSLVERRQAAPGDYISATNVSASAATAV